MFGQAYEGAGFAGARTERDFSYRFRVVGDEAMTFRSTSFDARATGHASSGDEYVVVWTSEGTGAVGSGEAQVHYGPATPVVFPTDGPFAFDLRDVRQSLVHFDRGFLERVAAEVHGTTGRPLVFDQARRPRREDLAEWNRQVHRAAEVLFSRAPVSALALATAAHETASAMLHTFPHEQVAPESPVPQGATSRVRAALEYMHAHAHTPITTTDVAEHVGLSVRGLQQAFQRQVGTAPNAMLRGIRMDRVRDELRRAAPGQLTVASVAVRWGFAHLGRFSAAYAERFGEYPRDTLRA
ncbi:AraC family transcriptional regulator [Curtobacterium sp. MCSS17_008]|nr:AraC family transcriptional regulator [Curtobacterium sp. MCSS17_008]